MTAKKIPAPWVVVKWETPDAAALQALVRGEARPDQQQRAMKWIIETLCGTYDASYRPDSERDTCFAEGKRSVGTQLVKLINLNLNKLKENPK